MTTSSDKASHILYRQTRRTLRSAYSEEERKAFLRAKKNGVTFLDSLDKKNILNVSEKIPCIPEKESEFVIYEDEQLIFSYNLIADQDFETKFRFIIYNKQKNCQSTLIESSNEAVLVQLASIKHGKIWYLELEKEKYSQNTKLRSISLPDSFYNFVNYY